MECVEAARSSRATASGRLFLLSFIFVGGIERPGGRSFSRSFWRCEFHIDGTRTQV